MYDIVVGAVKCFSLYHLLQKGRWHISEKYGTHWSVNRLCMERPFKKPGSRIREQRELGADLVVNHVEWQPNLCQSDSP